MKLTRTEKKILVYNKMKQKGLSYDEACKELTQELDYLETKPKKKRGQTKI